MQHAHYAKTEPESTADKLLLVHPDLNEDLLRSSLSRAYEEHGAHITRFAPPSAVGQIMYLFGTENVRENLSHYPGWRRVDDNNICRSVHEASNVSIVCTGADVYTGRLDGNPSTRGRKGTASVNLHGQTSAFDVPGFESPESQIWYLLSYVDFQNQEIRCELSLPREIKKNCQINDWTDRIILDPINLNELPSVDIEPVEAIDIPIEIKKAI